MQTIRNILIVYFLIQRRPFIFTENKKICDARVKTILEYRIDANRPSSYYS